MTHAHTPNTQTQPMAAQRSGDQREGLYGRWKRLFTWGAYKPEHWRTRKQYSTSN